ncbi:MAG: hypothetical protein R6U30_07475 [Halomonas sp.]|uniref:hypothetical protein n=1 Tax=Halomonas sp. TaxID=1486246 RepID=UPI003970A869
MSGMTRRRLLQLGLVGTGAFALAACAKAEPAAKAEEPAAKAEKPAATRRRTPAGRRKPDDSKR